VSKKDKSRSPQTKRRVSNKRLPVQLMERINANAAGIDCGATHHYVAVPEDRDDEPVRHFKTFTDDLHALADWLLHCDVDSVAIESTGTYWIALYEILQARGLDVTLVNARHVKNVPGRKSDVSDCQWLQWLHTVGLLRASFRPDAEIVSLRVYLRHRQTLVEGASDHIRRMQKAMVQMNLHLHNVLSDITGVSGLRIIRDIVAGIHDPVQLAQHRDRRCRATIEEVQASLTGHYREEYLFALRQSLELYDIHQRQMQTCDEHIESLLQDLAASVPEPEPPTAPARRGRRKVSANAPTFDLRERLYQLTGGVDLTRIDAIGPYAALRLISEIGTDMSRWPSEKHFTSWLTLAPQNKITGGRVLSSRTPRSANRAAAVLRMCVMSLIRSNTALGAFYRRVAYRTGKAKALTATARKLAILVYRALSGTLVYEDPGAEAYEQQHKARVLATLRKRAQRLGFALVLDDAPQSASVS
jgi:transposase